MFNETKAIDPVPHVCNFEKRGTYSGFKNGKIEGNASGKQIFCTIQRPPIVKKPRITNPRITRAACVC